MLEWDLPSPFVLECSVESLHIDSLKHVNNAVYVGWCQDAGWAHSQALGLGIEEYRGLDTAMAIRHAEYDYISAAYLGDRLRLATWLSHCDGRLQLERRFQLLRESDGSCLMRARWKLVSISMTSGKARRMPARFIKSYGDAVVIAPEAEAAVQQ
ncbi:MAG: acyl-CoA thioester hydrolase [Bermanella sp.]|jgi:acyl-CoA thioester hydrolase